MTARVDLGTIYYGRVGELGQYSRCLLADVRVLGMCCSRECGGLRLGWQYSRVRVGDEVV